MSARAAPPPDEARRASDPVVDAYKRDIDRTLLRENLKRSLEERLLNLERLQRFAREVRKAGPPRR